MLGALLLGAFHVVGAVLVLLCGERSRTSGVTQRPPSAVTATGHTQSRHGAARDGRPPRVARVLLVQTPHLVYRLVSRVLYLCLCRCCRVHRKQPRTHSAGARETNPVSGTATHPVAEPNPISWNRSAIERGLGSSGVSSSKWFASSTSPRPPVDPRVRELMLIESSEGHAARRHRLLKTESVPVETMEPDELLLMHRRGGGSPSRLRQGSNFSVRERLLEEGRELRSSERDVSRAVARVGSGGTGPAGRAHGERCVTGEFSGEWSALARNLNVLLAALYVVGNLYALHKLVICGYLWAVAGRK